MKDTEFVTSGTGFDLPWEEYMRYNSKVWAPREKDGLQVRKDNHPAFQNRKDIFLQEPFPANEQSYSLRGMSNGCP